MNGKQEKKMVAVRRATLRGIQAGEQVKELVLGAICARYNGSAASKVSGGSYPNRQEVRLGYN